MNVLMHKDYQHSSIPSITIMHPPEQAKG